MTIGRTTGGLGSAGTQVGALYRSAQLMVLIGLVALANLWFLQPIAGGDTDALIRGAAALGRCLTEGQLVACGLTSERTVDGYLTTIGPWPLLQYPIVLTADTFGATVPQRAELLSVVSILAFFLSVATTSRVLRRAGSHEWLWLVILVVVSGPLLAYASATWGEMLATALLLLVVASTVIPSRPWLVALAVLGATLTKETSYPFVVAIGLTGLLLARERTRSSVKAHLAWGAAGLAGGVACGAAFNVIRFGSLLNTNQLQPEFRASTAGQVLESTVGLLFAPNGGMLFFWPTALFALALACGLPLYRAARADEAWRSAIPALVIVGSILGLLLGLASWASPFGWFAWGPRLSLPWVWPLLLLALVAYGPMARDGVTRFVRSWWRTGSVAVLAVASALPHIGFLWRPETTREFFFANTDACGTASLFDSAGRYACVHEQMWLRHNILLDALPGLTTIGGIVTIVAVVLVQLGSLALLREDLLTKQR